MEDWGEEIEKRVRTVTTVSFLQDPPTLKLTTQATKINPLKEISRTFTVQFEVNQEWNNLFTIQQSTIDGAGLGLFAAQTFVKGETLGIYYGPFKPDDSKTEGSIYALSLVWKSKKLLMDPLVGMGTSKVLTSPAYFGLKFANDVNLFIEKSDKEKKKLKNLNYNMIITNDLVGSTLRKIRKGEEIFLNYNYDCTL